MREEEQSFDSGRTSRAVAADPPQTLLPGKRTTVEAPSRAAPTDPDPLAWRRALFTSMTIYEDSSRYHDRLPIASLREHRFRFRVPGSLLGGPCAVGSGSASRAPLGIGDHSAGARGDTSHDLLRIALQCQQGLA